MLKIKVSKLIHYFEELKKTKCFISNEKVLCMLNAYVLKMYLLKILVNKLKR